LEVSAPTTIFADIIDCIFDIKEDIEQVEQITASASNKTLRMLRKYKLRLTKILDIYGVKEFCDTVNVVPFDVNRHKNCGFTHTDNPELEGKISEVIQAGYVRNGTEVIIRQLVNVYDILKVESTVMTETTSPQNN
jgi:molecular chaperone GrpE (heat shock protein)